MKAIPCDWTDMFPGGVPGWVIFGMQVQDIRAGLVPHGGKEPGDARETDLPELSLIGLVAYFEGFVRYHFASCVNVCPRLLNHYSRARPDATIALRDIADVDTVHGRIGFLLADGLSFSSPKDINGHFLALLGITPFGTAESSEYDRVLHDRHQIVHCAGMHTMKYLRAAKGRSLGTGNGPYCDSVVVTPSRAMEAADFLMAVTEKIVTSTYGRLTDPAAWHSADEMKSMEESLGFFKWTTTAFEPEIG